MKQYVANYAKEKDQEIERLELEKKELKAELAFHKNTYKKYVRTYLIIRL